MKLLGISMFLIYVNVLITYALRVKKDDIKKICTEIKKKRREEENSLADGNKKKDDDNPNKAIYMDLVTNPSRPKCPPMKNDPKAHLRDIKKYETGTFPGMGPYVQPNPYKFMSSPDKEYINYLWDYLDDMIIKQMGNKKLVDIITNKFSDTFAEAKNMTKTNLYYSNPYTPPKLLFYFSKGAAGVEPYTDPKLISQKAIADSLQITPSGIKATKELKPVPDDAPVSEEIYNLVRSHNKNWDKNIFLNGVTPTQIMNLLNEWGWGAPGEDRDMMMVKQIVDTYDFNGDGNLNPEEFTIFQIHYVIKAGTSCMKNCLREIVNKVLEPLFMYLDCDSDGYINSENMWEGFRNVYRAGSKRYNMYKCKLPNELNTDYRTNTVNDFVLKGSLAADGFLTKDEFIKGILSGFWERQTDLNGYGDNVEKATGLKHRWNPNGSVDKECEGILYYMDK